MEEREELLELMKMLPLYLEIKDQLGLRINEDDLSVIRKAFTDFFQDEALGEMGVQELLKNIPDNLK